MQEIAQLLKISPSNVYNLVSHGRLVAHRFGKGRGSIRVASTDLDAYLEDCRHIPAIEEPKAAHAKTKNSSRLFKHLDVSRLPLKQK